ncbi:MAG TPA: hypothetical protein VFM51_11850 [Solirubrobacterales bacterium]|nr:hypothetical protein [Solirubrobacterales bacterium]
MLGRSRLPVLAEISGPPRGARAWSLVRQDLGSLERLLPRLDGNRTVLVAGDEEAAPIAAIALAAAASAHGRRTVLVECDLARPGLAAQVGVAATPGLHEYLRWEAEPADVLRPVVLAGSATAAAADPLVCICAGRPAENAETLLGLQSFAHMTEKLRAAYELVLLIAPSAATEPGSCLAAARQADAALAALLTTDARGRTGRGTRKAVRRLPLPAVGAVAVAAP